MGIMKSFFTVLLATAVVAIRLTEDGTETYAMPNVADTFAMADNMSGNDGSTMPPMNDGSKMPPMPPMNDGDKMPPMPPMNDCDHMPPMPPMNDGDKMPPMPPINHSGRVGQDHVPIRRYVRRHGRHDERR